MKISSLRRLLLLASTGALIAIAGCGSDTDSTDAGSGTLAEADSVTFEQQLQNQMNAVMDRLRYDDKSGLWENEFEYLREERTFDDYVKQPYIERARLDSLKHIEVKSVERFGDDSAIAKVIVHFENVGRQSAIDDKVTLYYRDGRWIKPTISNYKEQAAFDSVRNAAIEAAEKEAGR